MLAIAAIAERELKRTKISKRSTEKLCARNVMKRTPALVIAVALSYGPATVTVMSTPICVQNVTMAVIHAVFVATHFCTMMTLIKLRETITAENVIGMKLIKIVRYTSTAINPNRYSMAILSDSLELNWKWMVLADTQKMQKLYLRLLMLTKSTCISNTTAVSMKGWNWYFVKGNNPLCLLHIKSLGLYIYASTETIMKAALRRLGFNKFDAEKVEVDEGDILKIDRYGDITRSQFTPAPSYSYFSRSKWWYGGYEDYYTTYEETLIEMAHCFGADENDVILLLDYGYSADEVEELLLDTAAFQETVREVKFVEGEELYSSYCCGGVF